MQSGQAPQPAVQPVAYTPPPATPTYAQNYQAQTPAPAAPQPVTSQPTARPPAPHTNPNSTQNTLQIAEIRDGIVIMNDGSFRSVIMVKSINFDLMSPQEQEAVEYSYQGFLNSLYFPIQIFIRSQRVDLQPYIEKLDKIRTEHDNMLLALLMEDYINFIDGLSQQTNIMDKTFYIVIPYFPHTDVQKAFTQSKNFFTGLGAIFGNKEQHVTINEPDLQKAKDELRNRVQAALSGLMQCGVQGLPLDTQELIELYYDSYNPDTATRQQIKNFNNLTADVVTKGEGTAPQQHLQGELQ
jgi:type IV secretory pathway VirB4 component